MSTRKTAVVLGEYYHIYNRGVDKRSVFEDKEDTLRFLESMREFNTVEPIGSIFEHSFHRDSKLGGSTPKLVSSVAYCLNQNHFHLILTPLVADGIQKFMHRLSTGYTGYFNEKYERSGSLFQGRYKSAHIKTNEYLLHLSAYVNLNNRVHKNLNKEWLEQLPISSMTAYRTGKKNQLCDPSMVLRQFSDPRAYARFAETALIGIVERKDQEKDLRTIIIE